MESLNMNTLAKSLPPQNVVKAEQDLMEKFKASAMSITTLYRSALATSKQHYNAGYSAALEDLLSVIQQGVSVGGGDGMTIGRIMDWIDARREVIKEREEDEEEEEDKESKSKGFPSSAGGASSSSDGAKDARDKATDKDNGKPTLEHGKQSRPSTSLPTPRSPEIQAQALSSSRPRALPSLQPPSSPSPPPSKTLARSRPRSHNQKDPASQHAQAPPEPLANATPNFNFNSYSISPSVDNPSHHSRLPMQSVIGAKRRHAVMMETPISPLPFGGLDNSPVFGSGSFTANDGITGVANTAASGRRRIRNQRSGTLSSNSSGGNRSDTGTTDAMDVEDENGRERKRVARR